MIEHNCPCPICRPRRRFILRDNLMVALRIAIAENDKLTGYAGPKTMRSIFAHGLTDVLEALERGEQIDILEDPPR